MHVELVSTFVDVDAIDKSLSDKPVHFKTNSLVFSLLLTVSDTSLWANNVGTSSDFSLFFWKL